MTVDAVAIALETAAAHPAARLPCPICAASVNGENLPRHVAKVHAGATAAAPAWRGKGALGVAPVSLDLDGDALVLHHMLGLGRRRVTLPCTLEAGKLVRTRIDATTSSYADDANMPATVERAGGYLRFVGDRSIIVGCPGGTQLASHWAQAWTGTAPRSGTDIMLPRTTFVALEYALVARGLLVPRS